MHFSWSVFTFAFSFFCCNKWLDPNKFLLEETHSVFLLPRTLYISLLSFNECSLFLELRLAFIFHLDFCSNLIISLHQGVFRPLVYVGFHQKSYLKKVWMMLEKRKSFMQKKSGTKRSLFRLWPRLLHAMIDVVLIVCLVIFAVAWLVSNDWDCLMSLWKNHALFLLYGSICLVFSLMLYLGWLGTCIQHVWL
jgi:sensor histidine kinase YesM